MANVITGGMSSYITGWTIYFAGREDRTELRRSAVVYASPEAEVRT